MSTTVIKGVRIEDPLESFSKTRKAKIKDWYKHGRSTKDILDNIDTVDYNAIREVDNGDTITLQFYKDESDIDKSKMLRAKMRHKLNTLKNVRTNNYRSPAWREYDRMLQHPGLRKITESQRDIIIPNPDTIKKNAETYRIVLNSMPASPLKNYFELCLQEAVVNGATA